MAGPISRMFLSVSKMWEKVPNAAPYNQLPDNRSYSKAINNPYFRKTLIDCSIQEDEQNCYYTGMLNILAEHCVGSVPLVQGTHIVNEVNDAIEDKWLSWTRANGIGSVIRQIRRAAARTGLGIAVPYTKKTAVDGVKLAYKTLCVTDLTSPLKFDKDLRIYDGIEYDENWDIIKIYVKNGTSDPIEYDIIKDNIILWHKNIAEGIRTFGPECGPAFTLFPSVKRYMEAIVKAEEFRASMPMALTLDPNVYKPEDDTERPEGKYEYEPGMVPTLPPGTKLEGIPVSIGGEERTKFIRLIIGASARCFQMPMNLALGDSSDHNMASSQFDMQPWVNRVKIDRTDYEPVTRHIFNQWKKRAKLTEAYLPPKVKAALDEFEYTLTYDSIFQHPDPNKNASARATDLISGATTLTQVWRDMGKNARRELTRDAQLYGLTLEEYLHIILAGRTTEAMKILGYNNEEVEQADAEDSERSTSGRR